MLEIKSIELLFIHLHFELWLKVFRWVKTGLFNNNAVMIFPCLLQNIHNKPAKNRPVIASLDLNISIKLFVDVQLIHFVVFPKHNPVTVAWVSVFLQSVLTCMFVQFISGEKSDWTFSVKFEIVKWWFLCLLECFWVVLGVHKRKKLIF